MEQKQQTFWSDRNRADNYAKRSYLFKPEKNVIERFKDRWKSWSFLDLGVGAGRTTEHFAQLMGRYVGSDFSPAMVDVCRSRFPQFDIIADDARAISFPDGQFDFVAFSYNGISEIPENEIPKALAVIK